MHILHVISGIDPRSGGTVAAAKGMALSQHAAGDQVTMVSSFAQGDSSSVAEELHRGGVQTHLLGPTMGKIGWIPGVAKKLRPLIAQADIVHIHAIWEDILHQTARLCQQLEKPYLISPHGMLDPWSMGQSRWLKKTMLQLRIQNNLQRAAALAFTAPQERDLTSYLKLSPRKIVEPLGVDLKEFEELPPRGSFRSRFSQLGDKPVVMFLSRVDPKKGLDLLIPAFAKCGHPDAMLAIVGPITRGYEPTLQGLIKENNLQDRCIICGMQHGRERIEALHDADLFILPSYQENFAIVAVEAMASACPVIVSDQVNIFGTILQHELGAVVETNVESVRAELSRWLDDLPRAAKTGQSNREFARQHYDWSIIARNWHEHYQLLADEYALRATSHRLAQKFASGQVPKDVKAAPAPSTSVAPTAATTTANPPSPDIANARPLHALHVIASLDSSGGGPINAILGLSLAQRRLGMKITLLSGYAHAQQVSRLKTFRAVGIDVVLAGPTHTQFGYSTDAHPLARALVAQADIVHIHGLWQYPLHVAADVARRQGVPYIVRACGMLDPWSLAQHSLRKKMLRKAMWDRDFNNAAAMHYTADIERDLAAPLGIAAQSVVEPNGVNLSEFQTLPEPGLFRRLVCKDPNQPLLVFLSRIHHKKGVEILLDAVKKMQRQDAMVAIAGPAPTEYLAKLKARVAELGLESRVKFVGMLRGNDKLSALADADLFVLPSHQENFGIAVVEALACGTPVVISDQVNIYREIAEAGVGGVTTLDPANVASVLDDWLNDDARRLAARKAARPFVWERYDWDRIAQRWQEQYQKLIQGNQKR